MREGNRRVVRSRGRYKDGIRMKMNLIWWMSVIASERLTTASLSLPLPISLLSSLCLSSLCRSLRVICSEYTAIPLAQWGPNTNYREKMYCLEKGTCPLSPASPFRPTFFREFLLQLTTRTILQSSTQPRIWCRFIVLLPLQPSFCITQ